MRSPELKHDVELASLFITAAAALSYWILRQARMPSTYALLPNALHAGSTMAILLCLQARYTAGAAHSYTPGSDWMSRYMVIFTIPDCDVTKPVMT